jgi:hypothetical protein
MIPPLTDRISLLELVNSRFPNGVGVEIGVAGGHFTKQIVATWKHFEALYCVDPWKYFESGYDDSCNLSQQLQDERFEQFCKDTKNDMRVFVRRRMSHESASEMPNNCADFIYLDANHSFAAVIQDLTCWWPILKPGGIFAGHDYYEGNLKGHGVKLAVDAFAKERGIEVHRTTSEFCRASGVYGAGWEGYSFCMEKLV